MINVCPVDMFEKKIEEALPGITYYCNDKNRKVIIFFSKKELHIPGNFEVLYVEKPRNISTQHIIISHSDLPMKMLT